MKRYTLLLILALIGCIQNQSLGQTQTGPTNSIDAGDDKQVNEITFSAGTHLEVLALTAFGRINASPKLSFGVGLNFGINATNLILVAGENFSRELTINYDGEGEEKRFYFEIKGVSLYTNYRFNKVIDVSAGYKFASIVVDHDYNEDGDGVDGRFRGFYLEPAIGDGKFQYAFRIMIGQLIIDNRSFRQPEIKEFGVLVQPLILTYHFGRKKLQGS